jgi:DNA/RNA endonuclease YhcR with UshA esterase domain
MIKLLKLLIFICVLISIGFGFNHSIKTQEIPKIIINEFDPNPSGADAGKEWVELFNLNDQPINLQNWKITSTSASNSKRETILPSVIIQPNSYLIIQENLVTYSDSNKTVLPSGALNLFNSGVKVELIDSELRIIDSVNFTSGAEGRSWERKGPNCLDAVQNSDSNSIGTENQNIESSCWTITSPYEISNIQFSLDEVIFKSNLETVSGTEFFVDYDINFSKEEINTIKFLLDDGSEIQPPLVLDYYFGKIRVQIILQDGTILEGISESITVHPKIEFNEVYFADKLSIEVLNPNNIQVDLLNYDFYLNDVLLVEDSVSPCSPVSPMSYCVVTSTFTNGEIYKLKVKVNEDLVDYLEISGLQTDKSYSKFDAEWVWNSNITLGAENLLPEPTTLIISEVLPNPNSGETEWIEIYNYGDSSINLKNWYFSEELQSAEKCKANPIFSTSDQILATSKHFVVHQNNLKVTLNNSNDEIYLCDVSNNLIDIMIYGSSQSNISYAREFEGNQYSQEFLQTPILTPGEYNQFPISESEKVVSISEARTKSANENVIVQGQVTSDINLLGETIFYLQDETAGIRIDMPTTIEEEISEGQYLKIKGKVSNYRNELEVDVSEQSGIEVIPDLNYEISPTSLTSGFESQEGALVQVSGEIVASYSTSFDVKFNDSQIRVSILSSTGISLAKSKGDKVQITGVLSQYDDLYRILPRKQADVKVISKVSSVTSQSTKKPTTLKSSKPASTQSYSPSTVSGVNDIHYKMPSLEVVKLPLTTEEEPIQPFWILFLFGFLISLLLLLWEVGLLRFLWLGYLRLNEKLDQEREIEYFSTRARP